MLLRKTPVEYPSDLRAPDAIDQLLAAHRQVFGGFTMEDDDGDGGGDGGTGGDSGDGGTGGGDGSGESKDLGYPKDTPVAEMTAEQKAAYFEHKASKEESRRKGFSRVVGGKTAEQLAADLKELEELRTGQLSDNEKAIKQAADQARTEERQKATERVARAALAGALSHLDQKEADEIIADANLSRFVDDDGELNTAKVKAFVARNAPSDKDSRRRDFGAGSRITTKPPAGSVAAVVAARREARESKQTTTN